MSNSLPPRHHSPTVHALSLRVISDILLIVPFLFSLLLIIVHLLVLIIIVV